MEKHANKMDKNFNEIQGKPQLLIFSAPAASWNFILSILTQVRHFRVTPTFSSIPK